MENIEITKEICFPLSETSTREEVANHICDELKLKDEVKNILINEYITGDILPVLSKDELLSLNIKLGPAKKISRYIERNKNEFKEKNIEIKIYANSSEKEIKDFFEKYIDFKGELNSFDGKKLFELTEEEMKKLGLKYGQIKRLIKYISYFKTLKQPIEEIKKISKKSSVEEVSKFLKLRFHFSQETIDKLDLDGETLFDLTDDEIDNIEGITPEQKADLKEFINGGLIEKEIKLRGKIKKNSNEKTVDIPPIIDAENDDKNAKLIRESDKRDFDIPMKDRGKCGCFIV